MLNTRLILLILILSALALWLSYKQNPHTDTLGPSSLESTDYSWQLFNSTTWRFDKALNQPGPIIKSDTLFYDETAQTSDFTQPFITIIKPEQTLTIKGQYGRSADNSYFELNRNVVLSQFDQPIQRLDQAVENKTLTTEYITYNSITEIVKSDQFVTITQPNSITSGVGLDANLKTEQFQLFSDVKSEYHPVKTSD